MKRRTLESWMRVNGREKRTRRTVVEMEKMLGNHAQAGRRKEEMIEQVELERRPLEGEREGKERWVKMRWSRGIHAHQR